MLTIARDLLIQQGANFELRLPIEVLDSEGEPIDLDEFEGFMQARPYPASSELYAEFDVEVLSEDNQLLITLTAEDTVDMIWHAGYYDLFLVSEDVTFKVMHGNISLLHKVTVIS